MKRLVAGILTAALLTSAAGAVSYDPEAAGTSAPAATTVSETVSESVMAASLTAYPATMTVMLDGKQVKPVGYNINGNNYYKLRDIASSSTHDRAVRRVVGQEHPFHESHTRQQL
ncbi:MAG: hypothetical protein ACLUB2_06560 [Butyricicoccus pullicaecorum]